MNPTFCLRIGIESQPDSRRHIFVSNSDTSRMIPTEK